jgi:hypothetical protein
MDLRKLDPPREFDVGREGGITIRHCADLQLEPDEQVTLVTASGTEYDVVRKDWGYYATPSLNGRLPEHGLRPALVRDERGRLYLLLVEGGREQAFEEYAAAERLTVVSWLDAS